MALPIALIGGILKGVFNWMKPYITPFLAYWKGRREGFAKARGEADEHFIEKSQEISDAVDADKRKRVRGDGDDDPYQRP